MPLNQNFIGYGVVSALPDPYLSSVVSHLHFDAADATTTMTDTTGKVWTPVGNAQIDTAQSFFGGSSLLLDGTGDYITTPYSSQLDIGSGDYTIQMYIRPNGAPSGAGLFCEGYTGAGNTVSTAFGFCDGTIGSTTGSQLFFGFYSGAAWFGVVDPSNIPTGQWSLVEGRKIGTEFSVWVNAVQKNTATIGTTPPAGAQIFYIGRRWDTSGGSAFNGHIDETRITKTIGRPLGHFPRRPFPNY